MGAPWWQEEAGTEKEHGRATEPQVATVLAEDRRRRQRRWIDLLQLTAVELQATKVRLIPAEERCGTHR